MKFPKAVTFLLTSAVVSSVTGFTIQNGRSVASVARAPFRHLSPLKMSAATEEKNEETFE